MSRHFQRTVQDFVCEYCGEPVSGNGYTNHCPRCLTSKHVDINPGDRACSCQGMMPAVALETKNGSQYIVHKCLLCGHIRRNKVSTADSFEAVLALSNGTLDTYKEKLKAVFQRRQVKKQG